MGQEISTKTSAENLRKDVDLGTEFGHDVTELKSSHLTTLKKIEKLILDAQYAAGKNISKAAASFAEISKLYDSIPDDFLDLKLPIELKILRFRVFLAEKRKHAIESKFVESRDLILDNLTTIDRSLRLKDPVRATNAYDSAEKAYERLPRGFIEERVDLYTKLLERKKAIQLLAQMKQIHKELSTKKNKTEILSDMVSKKSDSSVIDTSLKKARLGRLKLALEAGNTESAKEALIALARDFPRDEDILSLYDSLHSKLRLPPFNPKTSDVSLRRLKLKMPQKKISEEAQELFAVAQKQEQQGLYYRARVTLKKVLALEPSFEQAQQLYDRIGKAQSI